MSTTPATDAFKAAWRNKVNRRLRTLAKIEIANPSAVTLRVATAETFLSDGTVWESGLRGGRLRASIDRLGTGPNPADITVRLMDRIYPFMAGGTVSDTLATHQWQGAVVTLYVWNDARDASGAQVLAAADLLQVFSGVVDSYVLDDTGLTLNLLQSGAHNKPIPPTTVDKLTYPNAPDVSQGRPVPIIYGDHRALAMRTPWTSAYGNKQYQEDAGAGFGAVPGLIVDPGLGAAHVKVVYASHACADLLSRANGYSQFIAANDVLAPLDVAGITESLGASESYITINDDTLIAYYPVRPLEPRATYNTADNARRAADPFDETTFASIDQAAGKGVLELTLPSVASLGYIEAVDVFVAFSGDPANANTFRVRPLVPGGTLGTAVTSTLGQAQSVNPSLLSGTWDSAFCSGQSWQFGGNTTGFPFDLKCEFTGGTTNKARVYWAVVRVKYRPQRNLVTPALFWGGAGSGWATQQISPETQALVGPHFLGPEVGRHFMPALLNVNGQFFANVKGYADDGSGTYTGTASALIERPCDIARHLLAVYGGVSSFETGASAFGSFALARSLLRNAAPADYKLAAWIGEQTSVQQAVQAVAEQSLMCVYQDRFTGKWLCHVWRRGGLPDYDQVFDLESVESFECGIASDVELAQGIRVTWGYDYFKSRALFETFVNATGSSQGFAQPTVVDQKLVVSAANEDIDWRVGVISWSGGTLYAATLTHGTYAPIDLASEIQSQMRTAGATNVVVGYGFHIKTGFNDTFTVTRLGTPYTVTLDAGVYDADGLAREAARALAAAAIPGTTWAVSYSHSTNKFSITSGALVTLGAYYPMGFYAPGTHTSFTAATAAYADRFYFANELMTLGWLSGASAATNCAELVGFSRLADEAVVPGSGKPQTYAPLARGDRQRACEASQTAHGPRADRVISAPWIRDENSAQQRRDREFDFGSEPPVWLRVVTHDAPDLQRFRTVETSSALDARRPYPKYGSDGSWGGKIFRVLEVEMDLEESYHTEFYAEEA